MRNDWGSVSYLKVINEDKVHFKFSSLKIIKDHI